MSAAEAEGCAWGCLESVGWSAEDCEASTPRGRVTQSENERPENRSGEIFRTVLVT